MKRIIVCGTRTFEDYDLMKKILDEMLRTERNEIEIISGHASGADTLGERYAKENNIKLAIFPAKWETYGKKAGSIRNTQMIEYALEEVPEVIAFWDGKSHGTLDTIIKAFRVKSKCTIINYIDNVIVKPEYLDLNK